MNCLIIYDIPDDRVRVKVADTCLDYGLDRLQYSAFHGDISRNLQGELFKKAKKLLGRRPGNIQLISICETDWDQRLVAVNTRSSRPEEEEA
jgi:CRISPR-associated protein Cas2